VPTPSTRVASPIETGTATSPGARAGGETRRSRPLHSPLGRLLAEWGEAPAGCLFLLPLWHPVLVGEQIGTLAAIAQGPFIMLCGLGWGEARFAAMGANIRTRPSAFEEALDIVRRLLAGETVSSSRRFRIAASEPGAASG
jgi:hypothetical protein